MNNIKTKNKVGDVAIDVPDANVVIQISSHFGARRQEAQRMGRILRPKPKGDSEFNAFFYTLVSKYTKEMKYSAKRQQFLVKQGYSYKVISHIPEMEKADLKFKDLDSRIQLLNFIYNSKEEDGNMYTDPDDVNRIQRKKGNTKALSGGGNRAYQEKKKPTAKNLYHNTAVFHPLFERRRKMRKTED